MTSHSRAARAILAAAQVLTAATIAAAQSATAAASGSSDLSTAAAVGIAVAVSVAVCFGIGAIIICLIVRHYRRRPRRKQTGTGWTFESPHGHSKNADQSQQIVRYVEEGSGTTAASAAVQHNSRRPADEPRDVHTIPVKVTSPDDLRFKICRRDGQILVATDPAHSSLCSREGVRSGDRILSVHVDIESAPDAHPKEISELLSLSSDYPLTVAFQHHGPVLRGPPVAPTGGRVRQPRPVSAAEKALQRQQLRDRPAEAVDGDGPTRGDPHTPVRQYSATRRSGDRRSRKSRAPLPPTPPTTPPPMENESSAFAIRDRRKRVEDEDVEPRQMGDETPADDNCIDKFERLCETLVQSAVDESEWRPLDVRLVTLADVDSDSDDSGPNSSEEAAEVDDIPGEVAAEAEEEQDVEDEVEALVELAAATTRLASSAVQRLPPSPPSLQTLPVSVERIYDHYELEEQDVVPAMPPPSADRPVVDCCTQFDGAVDTTPAEAETEAAAAVLLATPAWECLPNHPEVAQPARPQLPWQSLANSPIVGAAPLAPPAETDEPDSGGANPLPDELLMPIDETQWSDTLEGDATREVLIEADPTAVDETFWGLMADPDPDELQMSLDEALLDVEAAGEAIAVDIKEAEVWDQSVDTDCQRADFLKEKGIVEEQSLAALVEFEESEGNKGLPAAHGEWDPEDDDKELANYLSVVREKMYQPRQPPAASGDSTASSSALTIQEEAVEEVLVTSERAGVRGPKREDSLVELTRSMALRDVEVATVILLDSEARRRQELEDTSVTASSSGRSTVYEDAIDPTLAPDKRPKVTVRQDDAEMAEADANDTEDAAALNADFDLAAAEWAARAAPPPTPPPSPPPLPLHSLLGDLTGSGEDFAAPDEQGGGRDSPLLDPSLVSEIVQGARDIWTVGAEEAALEAEDGGDNFELDDSQLSGDNLSELLRRLEDNGDC